MARRRGRLTGAFMPVPFKKVLEPGGLMDRLPSDAFKLFFLALTVNIRDNGGFANHGGAQGPRPIPYKLVRDRFGWSQRRVARALKQLIEFECLIVVRPGGLRGAGGTATLYDVGPTHPWSSRAVRIASVHGATAPGAHAGTGNPDPEHPSVSMVRLGPRAPRRPASPYVARSSASRTVRSGSDESPLAMVERSTDIPSHAGEAEREPAPTLEKKLKNIKNIKNTGVRRDHFDLDFERSVEELTRVFPDACGIIRDKLGERMQSGLSLVEARRRVFVELADRDRDRG